MSNLIEVQSKKTATILKSSNPRNRQYNFLYNFEIKGKIIRLCKKCFLQIYGETNQSIKTINNHKILQEFGGLIPQDQRGKHTPPHKLPIEKHNEVLEHINSIPKYQSHYSRRHTNKIYFGSGLNLATQHQYFSTNAHSGLLF